MPRVCHANPPRNRLLIGKRGRAVFEQVSGRRLRAATMTRCCYRDTEATGTVRFATNRARPDACIRTTRGMDESIAQQQSG
jgi:hypothetical protein